MQEPEINVCWVQSIQTTFKQVIYREVQSSEQCWALACWLSCKNWAKISFKSLGRSVYKNFLEPIILCIAPLYCYKTFPSDSGGSQHLSWHYFFSIWQLCWAGGIRFPQLFPVRVCRLCSLNCLLGCFHNGQIDLTIWRTLGKMVFSRLAMCFIYPNSGEQHWILASHFSCWNRDTTKSIFFWRLYKLWTWVCQNVECSNTMCAFANLALWGLRGLQSSDCCWKIRGVF